MKSVSCSIKMKVKLDGVNPEIWRSFVVDSSLSLEDLHDVLQIVMGWGDSHMYIFEIDGLEYGIPSEDAFNDITEAKKVKLAKLGLQEKDKFRYTYDFGDDWVHTIKVEKILPGENPYGSPFCLEGARNCPPEDCGSIPGYEDIVEAMKNKKTKEAKEFIEWLGAPYDAEYIDIEGINKRLKSLKPKKK
jgi:hypothetical protein